MSDTDLRGAKLVQPAADAALEPPVGIFEVGAGRLEGAQVDFDLPLGGNDRQVGRRGGQSDLAPGLDGVLVGDVDLIRGLPNGGPLWCDEERRRRGRAEGDLGPGRHDTGTLERDFGLVRDAVDARP